MIYQVLLQGVRQPARMVTANGVVVHATHKLHWTLGHEFQDVHDIFRKLNAKWFLLSTSTARPSGPDWLDYTGTPSGAVIGD